MLYGRKGVLMSADEKKVKGLSVITSEYELEGRIPTGKAIILDM